MNEPIKPRVDFTEQPAMPVREEFKAAQAFSDAEAGEFTPLQAEEILADTPQPEASVEAALRPRRSLWRTMVLAGLAFIGLSVVGQGVQWALDAWQTHDWAALGGCAAAVAAPSAGGGTRRGQPAVAQPWHGQRTRFLREAGPPGGYRPGASCSATLVRRHSRDAKRPGDRHALCAAGAAGGRCASPARNQPFGSGFNADDCRQSAGVG